MQSRTVPRVITRSVIKGLGLAGAVSMVLVAPNSLLLIDKYLKRLDRRDAQRTLHYLKYRKLVEVKHKNGMSHYRLTKKGSDKFKKIIIDEMKIKTPSRWDKKWRLVLFDIPVEYQLQRRELLDRLKKLNFYMLQHSAWVHPFDCEKEIGVLLENLGLDEHVSFLVVEGGSFSEHAENYFRNAKLLM